MNTINIELDKNISEIEILPIADVHIGDKNTDLSKFQKDVDYILNKKNCYTILNGDILNVALKSSKSDVYNDEMTPTEQLSYATKILKPLADENKILLISEGNHERRIKKDTSVEMTSLLAFNLNLIERYSSISTLLFLSFGQNNKGRKQSYSFYITHGGKGTGRKQGSTANALLDMSLGLDVDIYIHSHTHKPMIIPDKFKRLSYQNRSYKEVERLYINTASYLNEGGYGEEKEYTPSPKNTPHIILSGKSRNITGYLAA